MENEIENIIVEPAKTDQQDSVFCTRPSDDDLVVLVELLSDKKESAQRYADRLRIIAGKNALHPTVLGQYVATLEAEQTLKRVEQIKQLTFLFETQPPQ